jgi:hypothetical protein
MPLAPQSLDHHIRHRLSTLTTLGTVPIGMAVATPRVPLLLDERRTGVKGISTLCAEEVACVPFRTARDNDFPLDRRLARFAARAEHFVEVECAVEAH